MTDIQERLAAMDDAFESAPADGGSKYDLPPDGTYRGQVKRFDFPLLEGEKVLYLKTEIVVTQPEEFAGREVSTIHNLENPDRLSWVKKHLTILGYQGTLSELPVKLGETVGRGVEFVIKTGTKTDSDGNPYRNVYINKSFSRQESDVSADASDFSPPIGVGAGAQDDDDIPF